VVTSLTRTDDAPRWRFPTNDLSGYLSRPFLWGEYVVVTSLDGDLRVLERGSGKLAWALHDLPVEAGPALVDKYLVLATTDSRLHCVDLEQRTVVRVDLPQPTHGDVIAGGSTVLCIGERGLVNAFTLPTMQPAWQYDLQSMPGIWATLAGGRLIVTDDRGRLRCLDAADGRLLWSKDLDVEVMGAPLVCDHQLLLANPERIVRLDAATGAPRAAIPRLEANWSGPLHHVAGRLVIAVTGGSLQVLDSASGSPLYRIDASRRGARCAVRDERLYVMQSDRSVDCFPQLR
jgi:outer membrane protein assembly factor BamB